jgi:hypothetical protein
MHDDQEPDLGDIWERVKRAPKVKEGDLVYLWGYNKKLGEIVGVLGRVIEHLMIHVCVELVYDGEQFFDDTPLTLEREGLPEIPSNIQSEVPIIELPVWAIVQTTEIQ